jgi:hypothetical protein
MQIPRKHAAQNCSNLHLNPASYRLAGAALCQPSQTARRRSKGRKGEVLHQLVELTINERTCLGDFMFDFFMGYSLIMSDIVL